jgi:hypothetical protein
MVLALSLSSDVKSIGAYAGFAAIVGLALLVILYFAQARETRRLSDALEEHEARLRRIPPPTAATMPRAVVAVGAATSVAQPRPIAVPPTAVPASPPTATVAVPGARRVAVTPAATVVAVPDPTESPAADAVTDVRPAQTQAATPPASAPAEPAEDEAAPAAQTATATPAPADPAPSAKPPAPETETPAQPVDPAPRPSILPAATAAGAAAAAAKPDAQDKDEPEATTTVRPAAMPLVARPAATAEAPAAVHDRQGAALAEGAATVGALANPPLPPRYPPAPGERAAPVGATARISSGGDAATATLRRERRPDEEQAGDGEGHHLGSRGTLRLLAVAIVLVGVLIFVANQLLSGGSPAHPPANGPQTASGPAPATVTVAVLNGTGSSGLASRVSSTLVSDGFKPGAINNAPSHNLAKTTVQYIHSRDLDAAIEVAHDLQLTTTQVTRADAATVIAATIAGRVPTVIAVIGTNYAQ